MKLGLTGGIGCGKSTVGTLLQHLGWRRIDTDALVRELLDTDPQVQQALLRYFGPQALLPATAEGETNRSTAGNGIAGRSAAGSGIAGHSAAGNGIAGRSAAGNGTTAHTADDGTKAAEQSTAATQAAHTTAGAAPALHRTNRSFIAQRIFSNPQERSWLEAQLHPRVRLRWETLLAQAGEEPILVEIPLLFEKNLEKHFDLTVCVEADRHVQLARLQSRGMSLADAEARITSQMPLAEKIVRADRVLSNNGTEDFLRTQVLRLHNEWPA